MLYQLSYVSEAEGGRVERPRALTPRLFSRQVPSPIGLTLQAGREYPPTVNDLATYAEAGFATLRFAAYGTLRLMQRSLLHPYGLLLGYLPNEYQSEM